MTALPELGSVLFADRFDHERADRCEHPCAVCGRNTRPATAWAVRTAYGSIIIDPDDPRTDDSGWFPVGSECAKLIPAAYRRRFN